MTLVATTEGSSYRQKMQQANSTINLIGVLRTQLLRRRQYVERGFIEFYVIFSSLSRRTFKDMVLPLKTTIQETLLCPSSTWMYWHDSQQKSVKQSQEKVDHYPVSLYDRPFHNWIKEFIHEHSKLCYQKSWVSYSVNLFYQCRYYSRKAIFSWFPNIIGLECWWLKSHQPGATFHVAFEITQHHDSVNNSVGIQCITVRVWRMF